jgi:hypothetical protein
LRAPVGEAPTTVFVEVDEPNYARIEAEAAISETRWL